MVKIEDFNQIQPNVTAENVDNIINSSNKYELHINQTLSVQPPKVKKYVLIDANNIKKIEDLCNKAKSEKISLDEIFLGASSLFLGAFLSALISGIPYEFSFISILSYSICPFGGIGFGSAYFFTRKSKIVDINTISEKVIEYIDDYIEVGDEEANEY